MDCFGWYAIVNRRQLRFGPAHPTANDRNLEIYEHDRIGPRSANSGTSCWRPFDGKRLLFMPIDRPIGLLTMPAEKHTLEVVPAMADSVKPTRWVR